MIFLSYFLDDVSFHWKAQVRLGAVGRLLPEHVPLALWYVWCKLEQQRFGKRTCAIETFHSAMLNGQVWNVCWALQVFSPALTPRMTCEQMKWHVVLTAVALIFVGLCVDTFLVNRSQLHNPATLGFWTLHSYKVVIISQWRGL